MIVLTAWMVVEKLSQYADVRRDAGNGRHHDVMPCVRVKREASLRDRPDSHDVSDVRIVEKGSELPTLLPRYLFDEQLELRLTGSRNDRVRPLDAVHADRDVLARLEPERIVRLQPQQEQVVRYVTASHDRR